MTTLRHTIRRLLTRPGFTVVAVATLALGIGANAAIFSLVRAVLLKPLPFPSPDSLVRVVGFEADVNEVDNLSPADFLDFERETRVLARMGAHGFVNSFTVTGSTGDAERVGGVNVTEGFFPTLGVIPALGRVFTLEDDMPDAPLTVLLSDGFWRRRFAADPAIVGAQIQLNARPATVVGVLPATFRHVEENPDRGADVFVPYGFNRTAANRGGHFIRGVGRLRPGARIDEASAELETIAARLERDYPVSNRGQSVRLLPLHDSIVGDARPSLLVLSVAVGLVLLIACANLANLLLAAGAARQREFAVRTAMGASRGRLLLQLLVESLVLSASGAAAGLALAWWTTRATAAWREAGVPRAADTGIDPAVLGFTAAAAVLSALVFGLLPALQLSKHTVHEALKEGGRQSGGRLRTRTREAFVAVQVALALVLLVGASLLVRSLWNLQQAPTGFSTAQVVAMDASLPTAVYAEGEQIPFYDRLHDRIRQLPGVVEVGAINILPLSANYDSRGIQIDDRPRPDGQGEAPQARSVTPDYFRAMGIPLVRGRFFEARDVEGAPRVVIVSDTMARRYWPGEDPIGKRMTFNSGIPRDQQQVVGGPGSREVVGVVGDVRHLGLDEGEVPMFYTPHAQQPSYHTMTIVARTAGDPSGLAAAVRNELRQMDAGVPLYQVRSIEQVVSRVVAEPRLRATLVALFAVLAFVLAGLGVYGVVSYVVSQRTQEIGIRLSVGATGRDVVRLLTTDALRPVVVGLVLGLAGAAMLSRLLTSFLFGVTPGDAVSYAGAVLCLLLAALTASLVPARRALRIDAATVLCRSVE
jgi:putative ABC transport system permease protein